MPANSRSDYLNELSKVILDSCYTVHKEMGPGLLESVYHNCLAAELKQRQVEIRTMVPIPLSYKGQVLNKDFVMDMLVADEIILELKSMENILPVHEAQIVSYLKLADKRLGFLVNFNVPLLKQGFRRFVNGF